jgi:hypothetical protein
MKTRLVILAMILGTAMVMNAQTQTKPQATTQATSQHKAQSQAQSQAPTKMMMKVTELPKAIQDNLSTQFKAWMPSQAYKMDSKGTISYEVMVKKETSEMKLLYDKEGKLMKEEPLTAMKPEQKKENAPAKQEAKPATNQKK